MLGEVPKLFDRNFFVGYFLPVVLFGAASLGLIRAFGLSSLLAFLGTDALANTAIILLLSWLIAILLLAVNRSLYMLLEGYGRFNPARLFMWREKERYRRLLHEKDELEKTYHREANNSAKQDRILSRRGALRRQLAEQFPDNEVFLLPTRFGNTMRAFEVYSRFIYGLEAIEGWNRLLAVVPKDYRELVNDAKAQTDFWLNLWALSLLSIVEYVGLALYDSLRILWFPLAAFLVALLASRWARIAAVEWGDVVKATFDAFLPDLRRKLGFPSTATRDKEKELWYLFSNVIIRRADDALLRLNNEIDELSLGALDGSTNLLEHMYVVQPGDRLAVIAQRFDITIEDLAGANGLENIRQIFPGQLLRVPRRS